MHNQNRHTTDKLRPLASIPNKEGFLIIGVCRSGVEAKLVVCLDKDGNYTVPGYATLIGWKLP